MRQDSQTFEQSAGGETGSAQEMYVLGETKREGLIISGGPCGRADVLSLFLCTKKRSQHLSRLLLTLSGLQPWDSRCAEADFMGCDYTLACLCVVVFISWADW